MSADLEERVEALEQLITDEGNIESLTISNHPIGMMLEKRREDIERLEAENERLKERVAELEAKVDPDPTAKEYDEMDRSERVRKIRESLVTEAQRRTTNKSQMNYKEVLRLFDNHPSAGYVYKLMQLAANADGFKYTDKDGKVIRVKADAVKDETLFHGVNNPSAMEAD